MHVRGRLRPAARGRNCRGRMQGADLHPAPRLPPGRRRLDPARRHGDLMTKPYIEFYDLEQIPTKVILDGIPTIDPAGRWVWLQRLAMRILRRWGKDATMERLITR